MRIGGGWNHLKIEELLVGVFQGFRRNVLPPTQDPRVSQTSSVCKLLPDCTA
jgi:hypothetical protein